jgi:hypothetical protein
MPIEDGIFSGFFPADAPTSSFLAFPDDSPVSSAAALDEDAACFAAFFGAGVLDLNRCAVPLNAVGSGFSDSTCCPAPLKGIGSGASLGSRARPVLRPLAGLGATMTSIGGVIGFDFVLILFVGLAEGSLLLTRAAAGGTTVGSTAALDELDAAPGVMLLALGTEAGLGTEAARGGATFSGIGAGSSFGAEFAFKSRAAFRVALSFSPLALKNLPLTFSTAGFSNFLILPLPADGGGPPPGGGAIPAGTSGGPGCMCNTNSFFAP